MKRLLPLLFIAGYAFGQTPTPTAIPCPDCPTITVQFTGVTLCTGCFSTEPGTYINNLTETGTINDTFVLNPFMFCDGSTGWIFSTEDTRISYDAWFTSETCSGPPDEHQDVTLTIFVRCVGGNWDIWILDSGDFALFYATGITDISSIPNTLTSPNCGNPIPDPSNICVPGTNDFIIANSGTASITICSPSPTPTSAPSQKTFISAE